MEKLKVILFGVGAMGSRIAQFLLEKEGVEIVGAIDIAEEKVGKDLGDILKLGRKLDVRVSDDVRGVISEAKADVVIHATSSFLKDTYPQISEVVRQGVNVVSTCEELVYPYITNPELAKKMDELAKKHKVTVLGTGINPGFLMDTFPITLTVVCKKVEKIKVARVMNAATRRVPFQKKIGAGLTVQEFKTKIENKVITGHVGLKQSVAMIADALAWELDKIEVNSVEPLIAKRAVESQAIEVEAGRVAGLRQGARGVREGKEVITLDFQAYVGAEEEYDSIIIEGVPRVHEKISPCVHGDVGTVAVVVNSIPRVVNSAPGLVAMKDLPVPSAALGDMRNHIRKN